MVYGKGNHFKDDIRKTFIIYGFIPIFIITVASYVMGFVIWNHTIVGKTKASNLAMTQKIEGTLLAIEEEIEVLLKRETFYKALYLTSEKIKVYQQIYQFTNKLDEKVDFYIIDNNMEVLVASRNKSLKYLPKNPDISWGITKRMWENPYDIIYECYKNDQDTIQRQSLIMGKAIEEKGEVQGYIIFEIDGDEFIRSVGLKEAQIIVTDKYDNIVIKTTPAYSDELGEIRPAFRLRNGYIEVGEEKYYIKSSFVLDKQLIVYSISSISGLIAVFLYISILFMIVLALLTIAIFVAASKIASQKTEMIDSIVEAFEEVEKGNLDVTLTIQEYEEFQVIGKAYNLMIKSIKKLMRTNKEIARQTVVAEIKQLESQFNPHFLFNTLEHIRYMAKMEPDAAGKMIISLSHLLRYSINAKIDNVTIGEDLEYTRSYLLIQKYRFSHRFHYKIDIEEEARCCIVPKLIIQPFIENAVKYGFGDHDVLEVRIKVFIREGNLVIIIFDDGIGIQNEKLQQVQGILLGLDEGTHMGLYNVHRRIQLMYGKTYGVEVQSELNHGTVIKIVLPIILQEEGENAKGSHC